MSNSYIIYVYRTYIFIHFLTRIFSKLHPRYYSKYSELCNMRNYSLEDVRHVADLFCSLIKRASQVEFKYFSLKIVLLYNRSEL